MATVKIDTSDSFPKQTVTDITFDITKRNIEALESACKAYREETKLPETMEDVRAKLRSMCKGNLYWLSGCDGGVESAQDFTLDEDDSNAFPALWQAEKLHALACIIQVWVALNPDGFDWTEGGNKGCYAIELTGNEYGRKPDVCIRQVYAGNEKFPFRTEAHAEHARRILTDDVIKTAFSVK